MTFLCNGLLVTQSIASVDGPSNPLRPLKCALILGMVRPLLCTSPWRRCGFRLSLQMKAGGRILLEHCFQTHILGELSDCSVKCTPH